jgi:enamine deaminase RidA (YjgF/YER057c/UK114 family)
MPKEQITSDRMKQPSGHFSHATTVEARGKLVFISGMTAHQPDGSGNMEHFDAIHKVRREYFEPPLPASTMVEVTKMTHPDYLIEISAIAVVEDG